MTTKYIVYWRFNDRDCYAEFNSLNSAEVFRWNKVHNEGYNPVQVTIHFKQINKYGDTVINNDCVEASE